VEISVKIPRSQIACPDSGSGLIPASSRYKSNNLQEFFFPKEQSRAARKKLLHPFFPEGVRQLKLS
jgi:hypothetical protein